nr:putative serine/threonine-protein kinase [Ipomoea batatas]
MTCFPVCCRRKSSPPRHQIDIEEEVSSIQNAKLYSYKELCSATGDFSPLNKIGEGGFGVVYKGRLGDGTLAAIKVLSAESRQGVKEFLTEIVVISGLEHENLVKLHGCCVEGEHRILVYGYLENNSLAQTLLGSGSSGIQFSCNGCRGYLAPEYVIRSQLTRKADIYSFGILLLEIVSGRSNTNKRLPIDDQYILEKAWRFYQKGELIELVDISLGENFNVDEACRYIKIALLCTHFMPNSRPSMSSVVKMLTGEEDVDDTKISEPGLLTELVGFRNRKKKNLQILSAAGTGNEDKSPWNTSICTTQATMTFTSISDRST